MVQYRKKPVVVEAIQYPCEHPALRKCGCHKHENCACSCCGKEYIKTLDGIAVVHPGDWIVKGVQGDLYTCKPDIFEQTYELVEA